MVWTLFQLVRFQQTTIKKREKKNNLIKFVKKKKSKNKSYQKFSTKLAKETKRKE